MTIKAILLAAEDDVASVLGDVRSGDELFIECHAGSPPQTSIVAAETIPFGHKVAVRDMPSGTIVRKYGHPIGRLIEEVRSGQHVHTRNLRGLLAPS